METSIFTLQSKGIRTNRDGRDYAVAPCVMLVTPGVYNSELVPTAEVNLFAQAWNDVPIVISHPTDGQGNAISAKGLDINRVGRVYDAAVDNGKLKGSLWIDIDAATSAGAGTVVSNILDGTLVEVSTGYFRIFDPTPGTLDSKPYLGISRHIVPDHLALLPNEKGACSVDGGCGVPRVNTPSSASLKFTPEEVVADQLKQFVILQVEIDELDLGRRQNAVLGAWWDSPMPGYPLFVFDTYVVALDDVNVLRVPYEISAVDGVYGVVFGQPVPVRMSFEPVTTGTTTNSDIPKENIMRDSIIQLLHARTGAEVSELESKSDVELLDAMLGTVVTVPATNEATPCAELSTQIETLGGVGQVLAALTAIQQQNADNRAQLVQAAHVATNLAVVDLDKLPTEALQKLATPRSYVGAPVAGINLNDSTLEYRTI